MNFVTFLDKGKDFSQDCDISFSDMVNSVKEDDILQLFIHQVQQVFQKVLC